MSDQKIKYWPTAKAYALDLPAAAIAAGACTACRNGDHINCPAHACACQRAGHSDLDEALAGGRP